MKKEKKPKKKNTPRITVQLDPEPYKRVQQFAKAADWSLARASEKLIAMGIQALDKK